MLTAACSTVGGILPPAGPLTQQAPWLCCPGPTVATSAVSHSPVLSSVLMGPSFPSDSPVPRGGARRCPQVVEKEGILSLGVQFGGGFRTGTRDPPGPERRSNPGGFVLSQVCLSISNLVQGLNVHLGTLIGKTGHSRGRGRGALRPSESPETLQDALFGSA